MNERLAKRLKEAGFSPKETGGKFSLKAESKGRTWGDVGVVGLEEHYTYFPTLSELIEACGKDFECMYHRVNVETYETLKWAAHAFFEKTGVGDSPEEAVANLWLALNKKQ